MTDLARTIIVPLGLWRSKTTNARAEILTMNKDKVRYQLANGEAGVIGKGEVRECETGLWFTCMQPAVRVKLSGIGKLHKGKLFDHLFGLDSQVEVVMSALQAAADSGMRNRFHCLLWGVPGCGKTEIMLGVGQMMRNAGVECIMLDATSTTEAGMRKRLIEGESEPDVILIEEIEKVNETAIRWLLGVMDSRAEIKRENFNHSDCKTVKALIIATANDMEKLGKMVGGALRSRFQNEVYCPRLGRDTLRKVLTREVWKVGGRVAWIEPTLVWGEVNGISDPRKLIPVCLQGGDRLLTGEWQRCLTETTKGV